MTSFFLSCKRYTDRDSKFNFQARKRPEFESDAVDAEAVQLE